MRRSLLLGILVLAAALVSPTAAIARDSDAPAGAPSYWLPPEAWVNRHWLPYSEDDLRAALGLRDRIALQSAISDTRSLADVARRKGLRPAAVVERLMRPWRGRVSAAHYGELRSRAMRTFTQPHLAVHMFFHPFHIDVLNQDWQKLFGVSVSQTYAEMNRRGLSYEEVAKLHRGARVPLIAELRAMFRRVAEEGVRLGEVSPSEARRFAAFQSATIRQWLTYRSNPSARAARAASMIALCPLHGS